MLNDVLKNITIVIDEKMEEIKNEKSPDREIGLIQLLIMILGMCHGAISMNEDKKENLDKNA